MALTLEELAAKMRPFANDICIVCDLYLGRLIGVYDGTDDYYYLVRLLGGREIKATAVGPCVSIKPGYPAADYARLDNVFTLNGAGPADDFIVGRD